jgi:hypothetical protein
MAQQKDKQEKASIATFYYAIAKGANLDPEADTELKEALLRIYPAMDAKWYTTFLKQARALIKYLGHSEGSTDNSYLYAWYDGKPEEIPSSDTTTLINKVWDNFTPQQQKMFGSKKDSWNTVDVYMVKRSEESKLEKTITLLEKEFNVKGLSPEIYVGTVNAFMSQALKKKILIPISLKKVTAGALEASLKETNIDVGPDKLTVKEANIENPLKTNFEIFKDGSSLDFNTNSLTTNLNFTAGKYYTPYYWETRMSGNNQKTELKDRVANPKGNLIKADAQAGSIPVPLMKQLIKEFGRYDLDAHLGTKLTEADKKYWKKIFNDLVKDKTVPKDFGKMSILGNKVTPDEFIDKSFEIDSLSPADVKLLYKINKSDFSAKLRQKLRQLVIIDTFIQAKKNNTLPDFVGQAYYRAAKMNLSQADLSGPFIKIS